MSLFHPHPARLTVLLLLFAAGVARAQYEPFALRPAEEGSRRQRVEVCGSLGYWLTS